MDTPDNNKSKPCPSLLAKFEDSPVFNYISTLSPIKQFSVNHSSQSFHLLSFTSPQSLQTPPISCPKESNVGSANHDSDASLKVGAQDDSKGRTADTSDAVQPCDLRIKKREKQNLQREIYAPTTNEPSKFGNELSIVKYEPASHESNVLCSGAGRPDSDLTVLGPETLPAKVIQDDLEEAELIPENRIDLQRNEVEHNKEVCEWEKFICESSDMFDCHSPTKGSDNKNEDDHDQNVDSGTLSFVREILQTPNENTDDSQKIESCCPLNSSENYGEAGRPDETSQVSSPRTRAVFAEEVVHYAKTEVDDKSSTQQQQTTRRRCLIYEMSVSRYRKLLSDSTDGPPVFNSVASANASNEKCVVASKPGSNNVSSALPGIGLHLNALAATGRDKIIVKRENLTYRRQLISAPRTMSSFNSLNPNMENLNPPFSEVPEKDCKVPKDDTYLNENALENSSFGEGIELPHNSPLKKRKKQDNVGEADSCKRCNCKRSKCLKLYCECFAAGLYCVEPCNCQDCLNKPVHEDIVLETRRQIETRNPLAFAPKVIMCSGTPNNVNELNKTPASARHKRGCNCKKSGCLKKYCECYQGGVGCSLSCRCDGCKNTFGRKEGFEAIIFEEANVLQKFASDVSSHDEVLNLEHENQATPEPSYSERLPVRRPFHFDGTTPQFPLLPCPQPLQSCTSQKTDDSNHSAIEEKHDLIPDDEASEFSKDDYLFPAPCVKSASPNCKRISSQHHDLETSPDWKSCRKLILRSIPSSSTVRET